jgi:hypothetical protein
MNMNKRIISVVLDGIEYSLGKATTCEDAPAAGRIVNHIEMKRDGVYGITKGAEEETHFAITLMNHMTEKDFVTMIVPFSKMDRLTLMDVEESKDKQAGVADNMQKVG